MDSEGAFTPIETFVSLGRRNKRTNRKAATHSEPPQDPPAPQIIEPSITQEDTPSVTTNIADATESAPVVASPSARSATPISSFGDWDEPFEEKKSSQVPSTTAFDFSAPQTQDDGWGNSGDDFFSNLSAKTASQAQGGHISNVPHAEPFGFDASGDHNTDFLASLAPASSPQEKLPEHTHTEVIPSHKKVDPPAVSVPEEPRSQPPAASAPAPKTSSLKVFEFGGDSSEFDSFSSGWNLPDAAAESVGWNPSAAPNTPAAAQPNANATELAADSMNSLTAPVQTAPAQPTPEPSLPPPPAAVPASSTSPNELPPVGLGNSSRSGGRGRRQTPNFATMMQNGSETAHSQPPVKSREPPIPVSQVSTPPEPAPRVEEPQPVVQFTPAVPTQVPIISPTAVVEALTPSTVPLAPPPSVGIDPPPARGSDSSSGRRAKRSAAERASQMYGSTMSVQPPPSGALAVPSINPIPAVAPVPILPPSHPQPIPVSEPLSPDSGLELFKDAPPRPSWASQVISPAPLTRTPEPPETPQSPRSTGVFDMFGGESSASDGADFFGKLSAAASTTPAPPVSHTPEPQPVSAASVAIKSPELTNVTLTPVTTPAAVAPPPARISQPLVNASSTPVVAAINLSHAEPPKPHRKDPISYPATPSRPLGQPEFSFSTPSAAQKSQQAENTQALIQKTAELEATQRQLGRIEREKDDLSRAHSALLERFRDLETSFHKLQRDLRDVKSRNEEMSLEADSRRETEQELRRDRDELQSQLLVLSQRLRQQATTADGASSSSVNIQQLTLLQRDNEQLRRAVEQLSKANEVLQMRSSSSGASGLMSSSATLATFEQAVAGVKQQYEDRLRTMQKKIESLLVQQQKSELEMEDLRAQKKDAETRAQQLEKFSHDDRQALQAKLVALQQRALSAETKLATTAASASPAATHGMESQVVEEQRRLLEKLSREHTALEQRCAQLEGALNQASRDRDMTLSSLGDAQQKNSILLMEKTQLNSQLEKLRLELDAKTRAASADSTQEALRKALADRDSVDQSLKKQSQIMQNLVEENAKLISTVDFYKQVSKESRDVSVIEQLHRDKNILLKTVAELSAEIEDLKAAKSAATLTAVASIPAPAPSASTTASFAIPSTTTVSLVAPPSASLPVTAPVASPLPSASYVTAQVSPPTSTFMTSVDSDIFKPTDLKQSSEFLITSGVTATNPAAHTSNIPARVPIVATTTTPLSTTGSNAASISPSPSVSTITSFSIPMMAPSPSSIPATSFIPTPVVATPPATNSLNGYSSTMPPPTRSIVEPPPMASVPTHTEDPQSSGKRRLRHIPFVNTSGQAAASSPPSSFVPATINPLPAVSALSGASVFVPQGPLVEAGNPPPAAVTVVPPPKRNSPSVGKRAVVSTGATGIVPTASFTPTAPLVPAAQETDADRVVTGTDDLPLMDVDTGSPNYAANGLISENPEQDGRKGFWGSVWKTVTLQ